jgi:hypothetical protein
VSQNRLRAASSISGRAARALAHPYNSEVITGLPLYYILVFNIMATEPFFSSRMPRFDRKAAQRATRLRSRTTWRFRCAEFIFDPVIQPFILLGKPKAFCFIRGKLLYQIENQNELSIEGEITHISQNNSTCRLITRVYYKYSKETSCFIRVRRNYSIQLAKPSVTENLEGETVCA